MASAVSALSQAIALIKSAESTYKTGKRTYKGVRKSYYRGKAAYRAGRTFYKTGSLSKAYSKYKSQRRTDIRAGRGRRLRTLPRRQPGVYNIGNTRGGMSSHASSHEGLQIDIQQRPFSIPCRTPKFAYIPPLNKASKMMFNRYVNRCSLVNEADNSVTTGNLELDHDDTRGALPLHIWSLGSIYNNSVNAQLGYELTQTGGVNALTNATATRALYSGLQGNDGSEIRVGVLRDVMVNLMLYSRTNRSTAFDVTFFKIVDDRMDPNINNLSLNGYSPELVSNYWNSIGIRYTQSPCLNHPRYSSGTYQQHGRKQIVVLAKKHFVLREQLSSEEVVHKKVIKFHLKPNQKLNFDLGHGNQTFDQDITGDAQTGWGAQGGNQIVQHPRTKQNIYMSIAATSFEFSDASTGEGGTNPVQPTYDIDFTNIYDVPREYAA